MVYTKEVIEKLKNGFDEYETLVEEKKDLNKRIAETVSFFTDENRKDSGKKFKALFKKKLKGYIIAWYKVMTSKEVCPEVANVRRDDLELRGEEELSWVNKICDDYRQNRSDVKDVDDVIKNLVDSTALSCQMNSKAVKGAWAEYLKLKKGNSALDEVSTIVAMMENEQ